MMTENLSEREKASFRAIRQRKENIDVTSFDYGFNDGWNAAFERAIEIAEQVGKTDCKSELSKLGAVKVVEALRREMEK